MCLIYSNISAFDIAKEPEQVLDIATAVPAALAPFLLALLRNHYPGQLYIMIPDTAITFAFLIADANNVCRYGQCFGLLS